MTFAEVSDDVLAQANCCAERVRIAITRGNWDQAHRIIDDVRQQACGCIRARLETDPEKIPLTELGLNDTCAGILESHFKICYLSELQDLTNKQLMSGGSQLGDGRVNHIRAKQAERGAELRIAKQIAED